MGFSAPCADSARPPGHSPCQRGLLQQLLTTTSRFRKFDATNSYFYQHPCCQSFETMMNLFLRDSQYTFYVPFSRATTPSIHQLPSAKSTRNPMIRNTKHQILNMTSTVPQKRKNLHQAPLEPSLLKDNAILRLKTHWYDCHPSCPHHPRYQVTSIAYSLYQTSPLLHPTSLHVISVLSVQHWLAPMLDPRICKKQILPSFYKQQSPSLLQNSPKLGLTNGLTPFCTSQVILLSCNSRVSLCPRVRKSSWCLVRKLGNISTPGVTIWHRNLADTAPNHSKNFLARSSCSFLSKSLVHCWTRADGRPLAEDSGRAAAASARRVMSHV
jgi:hypothetical protein